MIIGSATSEIKCRYFSSKQSTKNDYRGTLHVKNRGMHEGGGYGDQTPHSASPKQVIAPTPVCWLVCWWKRGEGHRNTKIEMRKYFAAVCAMLEEPEP